MVARRRKAKRRRSRSISVLNLAETYLYANVLTQGAMSGSPISVITGEFDVPGSATNTTSIYNTAYAGNYQSDSWASPISLRDLVQSPNASLAAIQGNVARNVIPMVIQSAMIGVSFKLGKRLLRKPLSATNRGLKMALGAGIRL
tara:strand:+ start:897 stop:1331 length:435 start_codon:yes stop_codon:yes gene_type:complete